jgi:hypothetical protein
VLRNGSDNDQSERPWVREFAHVRRSRRKAARLSDKTADQQLDVLAYLHQDRLKHDIRQCIRALAPRETGRVPKSPRSHGDPSPIMRPPARTPPCRRTSSSGSFTRPSTRRWIEPIRSALLRRCLRDFAELAIARAFVYKTSDRDVFQARV